MDFAWDPKKAAANLAKHGVSFDEASSVFKDPLSETLDDLDHSQDEPRYITVGTSNSGRLLVVAHTEDDEIIRIISARAADKSEANDYQQFR